MFIFLIVFKLFFIHSNIINESIIISLTSKPNNINNAEKVIDSILKQNVDYLLYKIILIVSKHDFKKKAELPNKLLSLEKTNNLRIILINKIINSQTRLIMAMKEYPNNPILIISDNIRFPDGWLEMFINDHQKYPNDTISASIKYFFGQNLKITEFSEGYQSEKLGIFNHVTNMIFNFALINTNLGGTLYPKNYFKNDRFLDDELFLKITKDSDEFWQSCFIIIENKSLRQSSKIYDYSRYIINNSDIDYDKKKFFETIKLSFIKYFPIFSKSIKNRQQKIIISFTSYPKRFNLIPTVLKSLYEQTFPITKIVLTLSKEDKKYFNLNISNIDIITTNEDLRPHNKYYYAMKKYRDYAIMTIDDDLYYAKDTFKSLFFSYLENPNIIIGRRSHYMTYGRSGELKSYKKWKFRQTFKKKPDFNTFLTGVGCILYPPDILNINDNYLPIINETITSDDITLKYFASQKGIPHKWVKNKFIHGLKKIIPSNTGNPLFQINNIKIDINIIKLEIAINHIIVKNLCVPYRGIQTGLTIYLFYIHNIIIMNNTTKFNIIAYSFCEIDKRIQFYIYFEKSRANCIFNVNNINKENSNILIASCTIDRIINNLNNYYFPKAFSHNNIQIKINNYRKYLTIIFNNFNCKQADNCILNALFYQNVSKGYTIFQDFLSSLY